MERIDKLIKLPVSVNDSYKIIDADGLYILEVGVPYILTDKDIALAESLCTLINGQSVCKAEKCDAPNCYEGQEPKGCLMEGAHKPVVDVQKMAEEYADNQFEFRSNRHNWEFEQDEIKEAVIYGSTLKQVGLIDETVKFNELNKEG